MAFLLKAWGWLKKVPGWIWAAILILLAILIPGIGWYSERKKHDVTKKERDAERDRAVRAGEVAVAEADARVKAEENAKAWQDKLAVIETKKEEVAVEVEETEEAIDEHAGDVDEVADDINKMLSLE